MRPMSFSRARPRLRMLPSAPRGPAKLPATGKPEVEKPSGNASTVCVRVKHAQQEGQLLSNLLEALQQDAGCPDSHSCVAMLAFGASVQHCSRRNALAILL